MPIITKSICICFVFCYKPKAFISLVFLLSKAEDRKKASSPLYGLLPVVLKSNIPTESADSKNTDDGTMGNNGTLSRTHICLRFAILYVAFYVANF